MISYNIELNIKQPGAVDTGIELTQGDYGNVEFLMRVKEDDAYIMNASSAEVVFNLPNGYIVNGPVSINSGTYSYTIRGNELQSAGKISAVLTLTYVNGRTSSCGFIFNCRYNPLYDRGIKAGPYITQLEAIMIQAQEQVNYLDALIKSIQGSVGGVVLTRNDVTNQIINDANKVASMAALYSVDQKVDQVNSGLTRKQLIATASTTEHDIKSFISASINGGKLSYSIVTILNNANTSFFGETGNFIVLVVGDNANYGFFATNLWNGKLWTGRFATYTDDWNLILH